MATLHDGPAAAPRWRTRLARNRFFLAAAAALGLILLAVALGPALSPYGESEQNLAAAYGAPGARHWLGTDSLGRDLLTRVLYGGQISLAVGFLGAAVSLLIGVTVGGVAGLAGGWIERAIMRLIDFIYAIPLLLIVIALMVWTQAPGGGPAGAGRASGLVNIFIALGLVFWLGMARVVRSRVAELRSRDFVDAARLLGARPARILFVHILPNTTGLVVVTATFMVPQAIFAESFLSFLGLGVTLPHASWGTLAAEGLDAMRSHPHVLVFPALAICLTIFVLQALGEALRAALDPRQTEHD